MKHPTLVAMSILSLLAACFSKKPSEAKAKPQAAAYTRFPDTDVPGKSFVHIEIDKDFMMKTFFIAPDKERVYVLGYKTFGTRNPDDPSPPERVDLRVFVLDTKGTITHRMDLKRTPNEWGSSMGMVGNELLLLTGTSFHVIDTKKFTFGETIPVWNDTHFPSRHDVELMTPDEQRDAFTPLFDAALKDTEHTRFLSWPSGKYYVFVLGPPGKRAAWEPLTYQDEIIAPLKKQLAPIEVAVNPHVSADSGGDNFTAVDGAATIHEEDILSAGQELDYPNYKNRVIVQYALTMGGNVLHFSTTDQKRQDRRIGFADNSYLTTSDGAVWVRYMSWLYRIE